MKLQNFNLYLIINIANRALNRFFNRCLYAKFAFGLLVLTGTIGTKTWFDVALAVVDKLPGEESARPAFGTTAVDVFNFILALITLGLAIYFIRISEKNRKFRAESAALIFDNNTAEIARIGQSRVHAFCGSITQISDIDIVVTSENTDLNLGSPTGTSVSGRIRSLAATRSPTGTITKDNLGDFILQWKAVNQQTDNFPLGLCIECGQPYAAASKNIKTIIFAVAIRKNQDGTSTIDDRAISQIISYAVDTAIRKNQKSVFIPIFGLGSGNTAQARAIASTTNAVKAELLRTNESLDIYLGVYRIDDLDQLCAIFSHR